MKKTLILTLFLLSVFIHANAQYTVYEVKGNVLLKRGKMETPVKKVQNLSSDDFIILPENAKLVLLDVAGSIRVILKKACAGSISTLIANNEKSITELTLTFLSHLVDRLTKSDKQAHVIAVGGNSFRGKTDSDSTGVYAEEKTYDVLSEDWRNTVDSLQQIIAVKQAAR